MRHPEQTVQRAVFAHLKARGTPGIFPWHTPNGGWRSAIEAAILKGCGVVPGIPDVLVLHKGTLYGLELKVGRGKPSDNQRMALHHLQQAGATVAVATGLDAALEQLEQWGLLRA
jgi:hypothetical protein